MPKPRKDLLEAVQELAKKSGRPFVENQHLVRDAFLMSRSFYGKDGEPRSWGRNVHILHKVIHREITQTAKWECLTAPDWNTVAAWAQEITGERNELSAYSLAWQNVPLEERGERWANIMLWLLLNSPKDALLFLKATVDDMSGPPFSMVSDCFHYLYQHHYGQFASSEPLKHQFQECLLHCLRPRKWPSLATSQNGIRLYLQFCPEDEVPRAFRKLEQRRIHTSAPLLMFFVDRFTQAGRIGNALQALRIAYRRERERTDDFYLQLCKRCCKLLTLDTLGSTHGPFGILRQILDIGVRMNLAMFNIVISNALRLGDYQLAWEVYGLMEEEGRSGDSYTYLALLDDAVRRGDSERAGHVLRIIKSRPQLNRQKHITSKTLHAVHSLSQDTLSETWTQSDMFNAMLEIYREVHDKQPLVDLGMIAPDEGELPTYERKSPPSVHALTLMISAFVKAQAQPSVVRRVFNRFYGLVLAGHHHVAPLAETDHVWNAFLTGMASHADLLNDCVKLVETMLRPFPEIVKLQGKSRRILKAVPTIQTWTILLSAFLWNQQPQTAMTVRDMMLKRGYQFNQVTWNVAIRGFASMQMVDETAAALRMMENENWIQDAHTVKAVGMLHDQERLRFVLDRLDMDDFEGDDANADLSESGTAPGSTDTNGDLTESDFAAANSGTDTDFSESEYAPTIIDTNAPFSEADYDYVGTDTNVEAFEPDSPAETNPSTDMSDYDPALANTAHENFAREVVEEEQLSGPNVL